MLVGNRMSHPVITIHPQIPLEEALTLMQREHISRLPVVDKNGKMVGILTEKQLLRYSPSSATTLDAFEIKGAMSRITVEKAMTHNVITVTPETPLEEVARIMADNNIGGMPVIKDDKIVGVITETDIFKVFLEVMGARDPGIRLTVLSHNAPGEIAKLSQAIFNAGGNIMSFGTFMGESSDNSEITLKVDGIKKDDLLKLVTPLVEKVVDVREKVIL